MFCLDYAIAFFSHSILCHLMLSPPPPSSTTKSINSFVHFPLGCAAGFSAACALFPFDIVRMTTVPSGVSHFAYSTIPFMSVYLGVYFTRDTNTRANEPFINKICWATGATALAAGIELPFDKSKINISGGSMKSAATTTAMRIPLGALLLIAYDQIFTNSMLRKQKKG